MTFFVTRKYDPPVLLRRTDDGAGLIDEAFGAGRWQPTKIVVDYMFGEDDYVEPVTEQQARELVPAAFGG